MENIQQFALIVFAFIGVAVTLVVTIIALVWLTCFMVRLLVKTFSYRVEVSVDVTKEDIDHKAKAKKHRNKLKRDSQNEHKLAMLKMKIESNEKIYQLRQENLAKNLVDKENKEKVKLGLMTADEYESTKPKKENTKVESIEADDVVETNITEDIDKSIEEK